MHSGCTCVPVIWEDEEGVWPEQEMGATQLLEPQRETQAVDLSYPKAENELDDKFYFLSRHILRRITPRPP